MENVHHTASSRSKVELYSPRLREALGTFVRGLSMIVQC